MKKLTFLIALALFLPKFILANELEFNTLQSDFTQTVTSDGSKIEYTGNFMTTHNNAFWHYETPTIKNVYFNYERVIIIEPDLEQVIFTNLKNVPNLIDVIKNADKVSENTYKAKIDNIDYALTFKNGMMDKITYKDKLDNDVVIKFNNVKKDEFIDDGLLQPIFPKEYDVIMQ